jgi:SAM-dependent methyltransferase
MVRDEILAILRCNECGSGLSIIDETELACSECHVRYPIREGVPIMVADDGQDQEGMPQKTDGGSSAGPRFSKLMRRFYKAFSPPGVVYIGAKHNIAHFVTTLGDGACIVDIGSGSKRRAEHAINLDISPFPNVDVVFDGGDLPIRDGVVDGVISTAVLEHVPDATRFASELYRVLKQGGQFLITVPFMEGFHSVPSDYRRYTVAGLEALFSRFEKVESGLEGGPSSALAWMLQEWIAAFGSNPKVYHALKFFAGWLVQPIKYFDILLAKRRYAFKTAAGFYYVGRKPGAAAS